MGCLRGVVLAVVVSLILPVGASRSAGPWSPGASADVLFAYGGTDRVRISPDGGWIAARGEQGRSQGVLVQRVGLGKVVVVGHYVRISRLVWDGPQTLLVESRPHGGRSRVDVVELRVENDEIQFTRHSLPPFGWLVDATPLEPGTIVWELEARGRNSVHRVPISALRKWRSARNSNGFRGDTGERLAVVPGSASRWILDRSGNPVAAWRRDDEGHSILARVRDQDDFEVVHESRDDDPAFEIEPHALASDGRTLLVATRAGGDFAGLFEFDVATKQLGKPVFRPEQADVTFLVLDELTREPVLAWYTVAGERKAHYFEAYRDRFLSKLDPSWDRSSVSIVSTSADRTAFVFYVSGATNPGEYFFRAPTGSIVSIAKVGGEIDRDTLAPVESLKVRSEDGLEIEAFLSLPKLQGAPAPLVVMPHGGPIGIRDEREYDPVVQYLTSWGFSILQVNYRGSAGYGVEFERAGRKQWARGIEDDIDAAVEAAMRRSEIDPSRICIIGGSYGGFSALASVIRHPDRYRCAVTINGVTDVPLMADSSDIADSKIALEAFENLIGDLETERDRLLAISPAYHVGGIRVPVLVVQGLRDRRVDPDHAHRLIALLELHRKPFESLFIAEAEHSFTREQAIRVYRKVRRFLTSHLQPERAFMRDPETPRERREEIQPAKSNP